MPHRPDSPPAPADAPAGACRAHPPSACEPPGADGLDPLVRLALQGTGWAAAAIHFADPALPGAAAGVPAGAAGAPGSRLEVLHGHALLGGGVFAVADADADARFAGLAGGGARGWPRAYAGVPIVVDGRRVGAVACMDAAPRRLEAPAAQVLRDLAALAALRLRADAEPTGTAHPAAEPTAGVGSRFLARMCREMREPLDAVIGFSELLLGRAGPLEDAEVRAYAEQVQRAGRQLLDMTRDVQELQRAEDGQLGLQPADLPLAAAVGAAVAGVAAAAAARGVRCIDDVPPGLAVRADAQRLQQVLHEIVWNAVKYNRPGGQVRLAAHEDGTEHVRIVVEDTGPGLKPAQLQRLFQPFERFGHETSGIEGTGLGLVVARSLLQAMGGALHVASTAGVGTRVTLDLPAARPRRAEADPAPADPPPRLMLQLLYVEDNPVNAMLFMAALGMADDVELRIAENGEDALAQVRERRPDVLVLDAHLPGMDGFELLQAMRREPGMASVPAFMCSADVLPDDLERAARAGFAGYWTKPIDIARILQDLEHLRVGMARGRAAGPAPA